VPCVLSQKGIERILPVKLPLKEQNALEKSAAILREMLAQLKLSGTS
jgi:malate/lactate dehydrogenase